MCSLHSYDSWQLLPSNDVQNSDSQKRPEFLVLFSVQKVSTRTERTKAMYRRAHHVVQIIIVVGSGLQDVCRRSSPNIIIIVSTVVPLSFFIFLSVKPRSYGHFPSPTPSMSHRGIFNKTHLLSHIPHFSLNPPSLTQYPYTPLPLRSLPFSPPNLFRLAVILSKPHRFSRVYKNGEESDVTNYNIALRLSS